MFKSEYAHILSACGETYLKSACEGTTKGTCKKDENDIAYSWTDMGLCLIPKTIRKADKDAPEAFCFEHEGEEPECYKFKNTSPLDLSLAIQGILLYGAYFLVISYKKSFPLREVLFLAVAISVRQWAAASVQSCL
eukprot:SAG31_NODE_2469_length_5650_cov_2.117636_3_plen_136_part_00